MGERRSGGTHEGGHTEYFFAITKFVNPGKTRSLSNSTTDPPKPASRAWRLKLKPGGNIWYDWWHYGGIVRDVWLAENEGIVIRRQQIRSEWIREESGAESRTPSTSGKSRRQTAKTHRHRATLRPEWLRLGNKTQSVTVPGCKADGRVCFQHRRMQTLGPRPRQLYAIRATSATPATCSTQNSDHFGNRKIEIHDRHLLLNGEQVRLTGMTRHEESPWEGLAETAGTIKHDYDDLKILHTTLTRPVHYPQHEQVLEYADTHGILFVPEIPSVAVCARRPALKSQVHRAGPTDDRRDDRAERQSSGDLRLERFNESDMSTDDGRLYFKQIKALVIQLDPAFRYFRR